jgi:hypothetical protein
MMMMSEVISLAVSLSEQELFRLSRVGFEITLEIGDFGFVLVVLDVLAVQKLEDEEQFDKVGLPKQHRSVGRSLQLGRDEPVLLR